MILCYLHLFLVLFRARMLAANYAGVESRLSGKNILLSKMHPFPCSALLTCFGSTGENTPFDQPDTNPLAAEVQKAEPNSTICLQPSAKIGNSMSHKREKATEEMFKASNYSEKHSGINSNSSNHLVARSARLTAHSAMFLAQELNHEAIVIHTHIPRPSIIGVPKVSAVDDVM